MEAKTVIFANWKMNGNSSLVEDYKKFDQNLFPNIELVVCPPLPFLPLLSNISLGVQEISHIKGKGAFTGEISAEILADFEVRYALIGHYENRKIHGDSFIMQKIESALEAKLKPVLCIGETLAEKENGQTLEILEKQIISAIPQYVEEEILIAYEPIWAIESRKVIDKDYLETILDEIIRILDKHKIRNRKILYGGAVRSDNVENILFCGKINGLLVGSASLNYQELLNIIKKV